MQEYVKGSEYPETREELLQLFKKAKVIQGFVKVSQGDGQYFVLDRHAVKEMINELPSDTEWDTCYCFSEGTLWIN